MRSFGGTAGAPAPSMTTTRSPIETRSPTLTLISLTVPACGAGTSMVALSDSRLIRGSSTLIWEPGWTWTSMIGISLKSPISGTRISLVLIGNLLRQRGLRKSPNPSQDQAANVLERGAEVTGEPSRERAVDDPVIIAQRDRLYQPGLELGPVPDGGHLRAHDTQDGDL